MHPRGRERAASEARARARQEGGQPDINGRGPAARPRSAPRPTAPRPKGAASPAAPQSAPAWASGQTADLLAALRGFLASGGGSGLGGWERASEGSRVGALSQLGRFRAQTPGGGPKPQAQACALDPLPSSRPRGFEQPVVTTGYQALRPGSAEKSKVNGIGEMGDTSLDKKN